MPITLPSLIYLYGLAGSGKSFIGQLLAKEFGYHLYEADSNLTPQMKSAISNKQIFTEKMRDEFFEIVAEQIDCLMDQHPRLIVTQATYKQRHREYLLNKFPKMEFIWIDSPNNLILQRILKRKDTKVKLELDYLTQMTKGFERPSTSCKVIQNDGNPKRILEQFEYLFAC